MDLDINKVFLQLKPVCDSIAALPTKDNLSKLQKIITNSPVNILEQLHEYIIFPLYIHLENGKSVSNIKQDLLETLQYLVKKIKLKKLKLFIQLCAAISQQIIDKKSSTLFDVDEETKLAAVQCISFCYKNLPNSILSDLYTKNNSIYFSQCVYLCVQLAKNEKLRNLRITAIDCLLTISYIHDEADFSDKVLRQQVAECSMFYLPGISIALRDIALGDEKQGHKITALAVKALSRFIVLHMEDTVNNNEEIIIEFPVKEMEVNNTEIKQESKLKNYDDVLQKFQVENKSNDWYKTTANNMFKIIENLLFLQYHYHEKVRYELSKLSQQILTLCPRNLGNCWSACVEILICLSEDENSEVCLLSRRALNRIDSNLTFFEILSQNFYDIIIKLPRIINGTETQKQLSILNLLVGYLRLFALNNLSNILQSSNHLNRLLQSLIFVAQMDKSNITLFEEYTIRDFEAVTETPVTWKHFKFLHEKVLLDKFLTALEIISQSDASQIIIDYLCDMFLNEFDNRNEIIFLINEIISVKVKDAEQRIRLINNIVKMYIDEENWYLPTDTYSSEISLLQVHNNIVQMCLLVEGLGCISNGIEIKFKQYLLKTLYLILERAGSAQPLLSTAGLLTLLKISKSCGYESVTDLIVQNTDYFSFHVTKRLKKLELNTGVLNVLNVIMEYSTIQVLPPIMNIVNEVLLNSNDPYQEHNITSFLRVFYSFVKNLKRWMKITLDDENKTIILLNEYKITMNALYGMYDRIEMLQDDDGEANKSAVEMYEEDLALQEEELKKTESKQELPEHIKLTISVLKRSLNFLPNKKRDRKLLTLNILREGIEIIYSWQTELLQVVHVIWSPLVDRFKEYNEPLIINRSVELLMILARFSKDFIRIRTCKEVLPVLCESLKNNAEKSYLKDRGSAYRYTQEYKLQLIILQYLGQILNNLEVHDDYIDLACKSVHPYLSCKQPLPLQEYAIEFYKTVACYDFDTIWLYTIQIYDESKNNEFRKNIEIILKCLKVIHW